MPIGRFEGKILIDLRESDAAVLSAGREPRGSRGLSAAPVLDGAEVNIKTEVPMTNENRADFGGRDDANKHKESLLDAGDVDRGNGQPPDPFDPARLRLSQDFAAGLGVTKVLTQVPVRKPTKESFVQVHPHDNFRMPTTVIELKEDREMYIVAPELREASLASRHLAFACCSRRSLAKALCFFGRFVFPARTDD